jgi:hypothetical protein
MPAKAGIQHFAQNWVPAFAGTSGAFYFLRTRTALPASHCRTSSTICV